MRRRSRPAFSLSTLARSCSDVLAALAVLTASCGNRQPVETGATDRTLAVEEERRRRTAADWAKIREAAEKGDARSQCEIGLRLRRRLNDHESLAEGVEWFRKAARQGNAEAMYHLGKAHHDGRGLGQGAVKDYRKAVRWFAKAADEGHAPAMVMAGKCHASGGHGLVQDLFLVDYALRSKPDREILKQCSGAMKHVEIGAEHIPFLESMLNIRRDWSITDAAITQLVRLDREKYLRVLLDDKNRKDRRFSPEAHRLLEAPPEEE